MRSAFCHGGQTIHDLIIVKKVQNKHSIFLYFFSLFWYNEAQTLFEEKKYISIIRSSVAEYLTFITATGESDVNAIYFDENVWLTQKMMGLLYNVEVHTINYHLKKIFADGELEEPSVIRKYRITASGGLGGAI